MRLLRFSIYFLLILLVACDGEKIERNMSEQIADFEFTTQDHQKLGLKDLEGEWWITNLMYTNCVAVCPMMTANMVKIQMQLMEEELDAQIVSFSVDPNYDTPEVLKAYAEENQADLSDWNFLTGYDFETVQDLSEHAFKMSLEKAGPGTGEDQVAHGTNFFLVNPDGEVIKKYDGIGQEGKEQVIDDLKQVQ